MRCMGRLEREKKMSKIAILTDSTTDLGNESLEQLKVNVVPMQIIYNDGRTFKDGVDITVDQIGKDLDEFEPKTSLPSIQDAIDAFSKLEEQGYTHCIVLPLSSGLSGTYNMLVTVVDNYEGAMKIEVIDGRTVSVGIGALVVAMAEDIRAGLEFEEVVAKAKKHAINHKIYFAIETLKYLQKGGRISKVQGTVGSMFDIKPILEVDDEGKLQNIAKSRGRKKSILKLVELFKTAADDALSNGKKITAIYVVHANREEDGKFLTEKLKELFPELTISYYRLGALLTVHTGEGTVGGAICWEDK